MRMKIRKTKNAATASSKRKSPSTSRATVEALDGAKGMSCMMRPPRSGLRSGQSGAARVEFGHELAADVAEEQRGPEGAGSLNSSCDDPAARGLERIVADAQLLLRRGDKRAAIGGGIVERGREIGRGDVGAEKVVGEFSIRR